MHYYAYGFFIILKQTIALWGSRFFSCLACVCILTPGCCKNADKQWFGDFVFRLVSKTRLFFFEGFILIYPYWFCFKVWCVLIEDNMFMHFSQDKSCPLCGLFKQIRPSRYVRNPNTKKSLAFRNAVFCEEIGPSDFEKNTYFLKTYVTCKLSSMQHGHSEICSK